MDEQTNKLNRFNTSMGVSNIIKIKILYEKCNPLRVNIINSPLIV